MTRDDDRRRLFEKEVSRLMDTLYGSALRLCRNPADAEDLVAETVAKAWGKLDSLRDWERFGTWILRILTNTYISTWRRRRRSPEVSMERDEDDEGADEAEPGFLFAKLHQPFLLWWGTPEQELLNKLLREDLERAVDGLPEPFRIVLVLIEVQGYSYAETAAFLEVPVGTVRSRLSRARRLLQRVLWDQARTAGLVTDEQQGSRRP